MEKQERYSKRGSCWFPSRHTSAQKPTAATLKRHGEETWTPCRPLEPLCTRTVERSAPPSLPPLHLPLSPSTPPASSFLSSQLPHPSSPPTPVLTMQLSHWPAISQHSSRPCTQRPIVCAGRRQKPLHSRAPGETVVES
ncbi:protein CBFA2T2-like [Nothobranchius furzeri]|uniref:protein CBFA2T2-like n=1 Tax=Nothobranchius furzeri TaxID=105023 RepID=UPI002403C806|nr:protein CBFA2T2-like [Nothobranchius furzeri]XP_054602074.1 protein CBFA2T2-like [Nothobranchius furzeri]